MSDIRNILSKLDSLSEQVGFRPGATDIYGNRIEPRFDISPVQDIGLPMGAVGGTAKPRIKVQPGQSPRQAISQAQQKIPTLKQEIPSAKPTVDPYSRMEPKFDISTSEKPSTGRRKDPSGPLPTPTKPVSYFNKPDKVEPTLEGNKFPGYWKGTDSANQSKKKMVGMEDKKLSEQSWLERMTAKLKEKDPYKSYDQDDQGFQFTPEQEKWLGGANRQDPDILKRMPGPKPPVSYFKNADDQRRAQELNFGRQNLNTVRSAVGKEKLAPEKFPTALDRTNPDDFDPGVRQIYTPNNNQSDANPDDFDPKSRQTYAGGAYTQSVRPPSDIVSRDLEPTTDQLRAQSDIATGGYNGGRRSEPVPSTQQARANTADSEQAAINANSRARENPTDRQARIDAFNARRDAEIDRAREASAINAAARDNTRPGVNAPSPGVNAPSSDVNAPDVRHQARIATQNLRSPTPSSTPLGSTFAQDVAARKAERNPFSSAPVKENKHNVVNRLARKFENYIENKFGIVEGNYIPKKKNLK